MNQFFSWLIGEAGAGWIIGIIGVISGIYAWVKRERPPKVIFQEIETVSLLDIHPSHRDKLEIYLTSAESKTPINQLQQTMLVIYNSGTKDITTPLNVELGVMKSGEKSPGGIKKLLEPYFDAPATSSLIFNGNNEVAGINIAIPYLNSFRMHNHFITGYITSEQPIDFQLRKGDGVGWSSYFIPLRKPTLIKLKVISIIRKIYYALAILTLVLFLPFFVQMFKDPTMSVFFNPSTENVNSAIQAYAGRLHQMETATLFDRFFISGGENSNQTFVWILLATFITILATTLMSNKTRIAQFISQTYLGLQPIEKFRPDKEME